MSLELEVKRFITISGFPGAGKSTVAEILAKMLSGPFTWNYYSMGQIRRAEAERRGITLPEFNQLAKENESIDRELDQHQMELAASSNHLILDGRMSWHFIPSFKVLMGVSPEEAARRMLEDITRRPEEFDPSVTAEQIVLANQQRMEADRQRYRAIYGVDFYDYFNYDLVLDSSEYTPQEMADRIVEAARQKGFL